MNDLGHLHEGSRVDTDNTFKGDADAHLVAGVPCVEGGSFELLAPVECSFLGLELDGAVGHTLNKADDVRLRPIDRQNRAETRKGVPREVACRACCWRRKR